MFDLFGEGSPPLAGGTAAAAGAALGLGVLATAAERPRTGANADARAELALAADTLRTIGPRLLALGADDSAAFDRLVAAHRLPRNDSDEGEVRRQAIDAALREATAVPLGIMRAAVEALQAGAVVARHARASARGEIAVAVELIAAGSRGAAICVDANVAGLLDTGLRDRTNETRRQLEDELHALVAGITRAIGAPAAHVEPPATAACVETESGSPPEHVEKECS